jgi:hypothetical protein
MHTSLRHYSLQVEREASTPRFVRASVHEGARRRRRPSLRDRIRATLRPGRAPLTSAFA